MHVSMYVYKCLNELHTIGMFFYLGVKFSNGEISHEMLE